MKRAPVLPPPTRRGLSRVEAADYLSISPSLFDRLVEDGRMPAPKEIERRLVWDRVALDAAFEALPSRVIEGAPHVAAGDDDDDGWGDFK